MTAIRTISIGQMQAAKPGRGNGGRGNQHSGGHLSTHRTAPPVATPTPCRDHTRYPVHWWYAPEPEEHGTTPGDATKAARLCREECPLQTRRECLATAVRNGEEHGIWAGVDFGLTGRRRRAQWEARRTARRRAAS